MYLVITNDYQTNTQSLIYQTTDQYCAKDIAQIFAEQTVFSRDGFNRDPYQVKTGHFIKKSSSCFPKYTVFYKNKNGYLLTGSINKIMSVFVVKIPITIPDRGKSKFNRQSDFDQVLQELKILIDKYEPTAEVNNTTSPS